MGSKDNNCEVEKKREEKGERKKGEKRKKKEKKMLDACNFHDYLRYSHSISIFFMFSIEISIENVTSILRIFYAWRPLCGTSLTRVTS